MTEICPNKRRSGRGIVWYWEKAILTKKKGKCEPGEPIPRDGQQLRQVVATIWMFWRIVLIANRNLKRNYRVTLWKNNETPCPTYCGICRGICRPATQFWGKIAQQTEFKASGGVSGAGLQSYEATIPLENWLNVTCLNYRGKRKNGMWLVRIAEEKGKTKLQGRNTYGRD